MLSYSQIVRKDQEREKERKKELYDKIFSCYLTTILARDKEVVAVWLSILQDRCEIYLSKNSDWLDKDNKFIDNITKYLKNISKNAPAKSEDNERNFLVAVTLYCSTKLESRLKKLKDDIEFYGDDEHVKSFKDFFSAKVGDTNNTSTITISGVCKEYYKKIKKAKVESRIPSEFLRHIKKVASYMVSVIGIIKCARNIQYKSLFSNIQVFKGGPVIINNQPIYSWKNIIKRFIDEDKYKCFMDRCSEMPEVMERISKVYTDNATRKQQQLDGDDVKKYICSHAQMNILALIINKGIKSRVFIAVFKRCCYLCKLYTDFARKQGYNIIVFEPQFFTNYAFDWKYMKICSEWQLPHVEDNDFKARSLIYILKNLDQIIEKKLKHYTSSLSANSSDDNIDMYIKKFSNEFEKFEKYTLLP
ncbi:hypothetical protein RhiirB3_428580 [Rhizophagus irregularis]|nr:hypothetical protein RhiirB3_428580 [Rhizophagus irregularis]